MDPVVRRMDVSSRWELEVFPYLNHFLLLADDAEPADLTGPWIDESIVHAIAAEPGMVCVGTARRLPVNVSIEVRDEPPDRSIDDADHVTEAGLTTHTGTVRIDGGCEEPGQEPRFAVAPGTYRVRVYTSGFDTLDEYLIDGEDRYDLVLWPGTEEPPRVLKRYPGAFPGG